MTPLLFTFAAFAPILAFAVPLALAFLLKAAMRRGVGQ